MGWTSEALKNVKALSVGSNKPKNTVHGGVASVAQGMKSVKPEPITPKDISMTIPDKKGVVEHLVKASIEATPPEAVRTAIANHRKNPARFYNWNEEEKLNEG